MPRLVLDDVLQAWDADLAPDGFVERVMRLSAEQCDGLEPIQSPLDAWEGQAPPDGFAERIVRLAEEQRMAHRRRMRRGRWVVAGWMAAAAAGLFGGRLAMPAEQAQTLVSIPANAVMPKSLPAAPALPVSPALAENKDPRLPRNAEPRSVSRAHAAHTERVARKPSPALGPAPSRAPSPRPQRAPSREQPPEPSRALANAAAVPNKVLPVQPIPALSEDGKQAVFDLAAYKKARASALDREKRFNKTESSGLLLASTYRLVP